jgi:arylsulfatase A-like enzyme
MIQWKGHIPAGKVDDSPIIQLDILPTSLAAAGVAVKPELKLDGVNLLPYLTGQNTGSPHEMLYWRFGQQIALRMGDWKLVKSVGNEAIGGTERNSVASTAGAELYNLKNDIGEKENLAEKEPARFQQMAAAWDEWNSQLVEPAWRLNRNAGAKAKAKRKQQ